MTSTLPKSSLEVKQVRASSPPPLELILTIPCKRLKFSAINVSPQRASHFSRPPSVYIPVESHPSLPPFEIMTPYIDSNGVQKLKVVSECGLFYSNFLYLKFPDFSQ